ncbi:hypothetical protein [Nocardia mexicana]|uniref:Uncharacterized protein n=1 Tax=Nocardia mexicana TaxID=279262 RepID=A0A370HIL2_9NOCA|nr:hypothetical protein [Nocardia mexicana]RDI55309.1 hypothetical protein DFR68_101142 [Nocardia mexicana]
MGDIGPVRRRIEVVPETRPVLPVPHEPERPERPEVPVPAREPAPAR